jgi:hypothetical protein
MAATDASCNNSAGNKPKRLVKTPFVPENDDESRLAAKLANRVVYQANNRSTGPICESNTFTFVLYADNEAKTLIAPQVVIHQNGDEAVLAADLTKAVATILGLKNEHSAMLKINLYNTWYCLTPQVKKLAQEYDMLAKKSATTRPHCLEDPKARRASEDLTSAIIHRHSAWSRVFTKTSGVIDLKVTLHCCWFTVKWTGSNELVAPNVFVEHRLAQYKSHDLVQQVASLANITDCKTIKLTLGSPAGPELSAPLHRLNSDHNKGVPTFLQKERELETHWRLVHDHPRNLLLETPVKPLELFLSTHSSVALAVDTLYECYNRCMEVFYAYSCMEPKLRENPRVALTAIQLDEHFQCLSKFVPRRFLSNKQFVLRALAVCRKMGFCGSVFKWADAKLKDDIDVVTTAVKFEGRLLQHTSEAMRASKSVVLAAVSNDWEAVKYASSQLQSDPDVIAAMQGPTPALLIF